MKSVELKDVLQYNNNNNNNSLFESLLFVQRSHSCIKLLEMLVLRDSGDTLGFSSHAPWCWVACSFHCSSLSSFFFYLN